MVGHAANTVHGSVYLHRNALPMSLLKEGIEKLDFQISVGDPQSVLR